MVFSGIVEAATIYVRDCGGSCGTNDGSDWANPLDDLPTDLTRGNVYYVADGNYADHVFNEPESGTTLITVKKATGADHGTETGWVSTYGDGQAAFSVDSGQMQIATSYYVIDGQVGGGPAIWGTNGTDDGTSYGFRIFTTLTGDAKLVNITAPVSNITLKHIDFSFDGNTIYNWPPDLTNPGKWQDSIYSVNSVSNLTVSYARFWRSGRTCFLSRGTWSNITVEYTFFEKCTITTVQGPGSQPHGQLWSASHGSGEFNGITFRWNFILDFDSTGGITMAGGDGVDIYGNIFNGVSGQANGVLANWSTETLTTNVRVYNNTFVDTDAAIGIGNNSGWVAKNNLFYSNNRTSFTNTTHDYSYTDVSLGETNEQVNVSNPFTNYAGKDFSLASATNAGETLAAPYNVDMFGNVRGGDGTWDRGAIEKVTGGGPQSPVLGSVDDKTGDSGGSLLVDFTQGSCSGLPEQRIYYSLTSGGPWTLGYTENPCVTAKTDAEISDLTNDVTYYIIARSYNGSTESPNSNQLSGIPRDNSAPSPPLNLVAVDRPFDSGGAINLTWDEPTQLNITAQEIYRDTSPTATTLIHTINDRTSSSYTDTGLNNGTTYYYRLRFFNQYGPVYSGYSNEDSASPADNSVASEPGVRGAPDYIGEKIIYPGTNTFEKICLLDEPSDLCIPDLTLGVDFIYKWECGAESGTIDNAGDTDDEKAGARHTLTTNDDLYTYCKPGEIGNLWPEGLAPDYNGAIVQGGIMWLTRAVTNDSIYQLYNVVDQTNEGGDQNPTTTSFDTDLTYVSDFTDTIPRPIIYFPTVEQDSRQDSNCNVQGRRTLTTNYNTSTKVLSVRALDLAPDYRCKFRFF